LASRLILSIGDVQPLSWDSKDKEIFTMLDEICIANKQNPLLKSSNDDVLAHHLLIKNNIGGHFYDLIKDIYSSTKCAIKLSDNRT
jgi:hypothetical protein